MTETQATRRRLGAEVYALLGILFLAALAAILYVRPPLRGGGGGMVSQPTGTVLSIDLVNEAGLADVVLTDVTFIGGASPQVLAVDNRGGELADSVALRLPDVPGAVSGPVPGWRIPPWPTGKPGRNVAVRLTWEAGAEWPQTMTIHYRYLGLPMSLDIPLAERLHRMLPAQ